MHGSPTRMISYTIGVPIQSRKGMECMNLAGFRSTDPWYATWSEGSRETIPVLPDTFVGRKRAPSNSIIISAIKHCKVHRLTFLYHCIGNGQARTFGLEPLSPIEPLTLSLWGPLLRPCFLRNRSIFIISTRVSLCVANGPSGIWRRVIKSEVVRCIFLARSGRQDIASGFRNLFSMCCARRGMSTE